MQKMMGVQKHSKFARKFCLPPFLGQRDSWIIYTIICYKKDLSLRHHLRLSSSGLGLPCTGADCLKEEASTYFSLSSSAFSVTGSTSRILFWVSIGKRWRGILRPCSNNSLLFLWWQLYIYLWPVSRFFLSGKNNSAANWLPRGTVVKSISTWKIKTECRWRRE